MVSGFKLANKKKPNVTKVSQNLLLVLFLNLRIVLEEAMLIPAININPNDITS